MTASQFDCVFNLSPSEYEVFLRLGEGKSSAEICEERGVNGKTIGSQYAAIAKKLDKRHIWHVRAFAAVFVHIHGKPAMRRTVTVTGHFVPEGKR